MKKNIRELKFSELEDLLIKLKEPAYRSRQIYRWLWKEKVSSFDQMTNISKSCQNYFSQNYSIQYVAVDTLIKSNDGTIKFLFKLSDGNKCEGVLIPEKNRITACISSQVGCSFS